MSDFPAMIEAAKAENANGINMRGGKRYTSAAIRLEIARRHLGPSIGIETELLHWSPEKGAPIVVRALIRDIESGRILATGTAEEIRGQGNVNQTSALENAETSALGRALAMLGLSGGEFASANEMDGVERKKEAQAKPNSVSDKPNSVSETKSVSAPVLSQKDGAALVQAINERNTPAEVDGYMAALRQGPMAHAADHPKIVAAANARKAALGVGIAAE